MKLINPDAELYKLGRFEGIRYLGCGGFGLVFLAYDPKLDRKVALKLRRRGRGSAADLGAEARKLAKVKHPNVVTVYETGVHDGDVFFVMELVENCRTARKFTYERPRPSWRKILDVYRGAGAGLLAVHAAGLVHYDFKPGNILLDELDWPRIVDFGLARGKLERWAAGQRPGTRPYTAPEIFAGRPGDVRSDVYSFCAALWEALNGVPPYEAESTRELLDKIGHGEPFVNTNGVPQALLDVLRKGLSFDPNDRYPDMRAVLREIDKLRQPPRAAAKPSTDSSPRDAGTRLIWAGMLGLMLLAIGLVGGQLLASGSSGHGFVDHIVAMSAGPRAVSLARAGDGDGALQLLENAQLRGSNSQMRLLAVASQKVAAELETNGLWLDASLAWAMSIRLAQNAGDSELERAGHVGYYGAIQRVQPAKAHGPRNR